MLGGGQWDWEGPSTPFPIKAGLSIVFSNFSDERWRLIDAMVDDGNLATGRFRKMSDGRVAMILEK